MGKRSKVVFHYPDSPKSKYVKPEKPEPEIPISQFREAQAKDDVQRFLANALVEGEKLKEQGLIRP